MGWHLGTGWLSAHISWRAGTNRTGLFLCDCLSSTWSKPQAKNTKKHFKVPLSRAVFHRYLPDSCTLPDDLISAWRISSTHWNSFPAANTAWGRLFSLFWGIYREGVFGSPFMLWVGSFHRHCVIGWANVTLRGGKLKTKAKPCEWKAKSMRLKRNVKAGLLFLSKNTFSEDSSPCNRAILQQRLLQPHLKQFHSLRPPPLLAQFSLWKKESVSRARGLGFSSEGEQGYRFVISDILSLSYPHSFALFKSCASFS